MVNRSPSRRGLLTGALTTLAAGLAAQAGADTPSEIPLWPNVPPGSDGVSVKETLTDNREKSDQINRSITGVRIPTLNLVRPKTPNGAGVLVLPGGGFNSLAYDKEGTEVAAWLATLGFTAAALKYRLPADGWKAGIDVAVQDGQRALRLLRQEMKGGKVGVMGFSAGGYLAAALATRFNERLDGQVDQADAQSARPDFAALVYPGFGSDAQGIPEIGKKVTSDTSPAFIVHAADDPKAPPGGSILATARLLSLKVPVELHLFETGGHGFALRRPPADHWPDLFKTWVEARLKA
ncbi:MAG TPA: alpha/beta hydrolase [Asticcacaulis sp.]|nr:alpha/beta hydrolase [Asticcacaulis sp.]